MIRRPSAITGRGDAGVTLAETLVTVVAGGIVLAAAAALFVPAAQNSDRARRASLNLTAATTASAQLQRQVTDASSVTVTNNGNNLTLCTYATAGAASRSAVEWTFTTVTGGTTLTGGSAVYGDEKTFSSVRFGAGINRRLDQGDVLRIQLTTSGVTGSGTSTGVPSTVLDLSTSPRSTQQNGTCS